MTFYEELFDALPSHIKDDSDFSKLLKLFFDVIEENYELSLNTLQAKMVDALYDKFVKTHDLHYHDRREQLLKFHLNELFSAIEDTYKNEAFFDRLAKDFERLGLESSDFDIEEKFLETLHQSNINANKSFNSNKGKLISFVYAFNMVSNASLQGLNASDGFIKVLENLHPATGEPVPFSYRVESSLYKETFDTIIKPLTHPIGFGSAFVTLLTFIFEDFFLVKEVKHLESLVIRCLQPDGSYIETNMLEHQLVGFNEISTDSGTEFWMKYKDKDSGELKKLLVSYDNVVRIYSLENLKIKNIRLMDPLQGVFTEIKDADGTIQAIDYNQYFINRKQTLWIYFTLENDLSNKEYTSIINYNPDQFSVVPGESYLQPMRISAADIFNAVYGDLHGRLVEELPRTCGIHYNIRVERTTQIKEEMLFKLRLGYLDFFARVPRTEATSTTIYYIGKAVDPNKNPSEWIPYIGDFDIRDTKPHEISTTKYFIGRAYDATKTPSEWEPLINETGFYVSSENTGGLNSDNNFGLYPFEVSATPIPEFEILGKDEEFWLKQFPRYDTSIDTNIVTSSGVEAFDKHSVAWDVMLSEHKISFTKNDIGSYLTPKEWRIGEFNISDEFSDDEIADFLNGVKPLPTGKRILTIGNMYDNTVADGDLYPTREINDNDIAIKSTTYNNLIDDVELNKSDEELKSEITSSDFDYIYRNVIGDHLTIDGSWTIDSDFDIISFEQIINLTKDDIGLATSKLNIGSFVIGNDYTDDEIEKAQKGELKVTKDIVFVGYKYGKELIVGERYPTIEINDENLNIYQESSNTIADNVNIITDEFYNIESQNISDKVEISTDIGFADSINLTKEDLGFNEVKLYVGGFEIGNDYTDDQFEAALSGNFVFTKEPVFIDYKYGKELIMAEKYPFLDITEDLQFNIIKAP